MDIKTNAMRILDREKIPYQSHCYEGSGAVSAVEVAAALGQDPARLFKTLVTVAKSRKHYVFVIPSAATLDLKKAAASVDEKSIDMLPMKELFALTGYVHGGCSPIGMKKPFRTVVHLSAEGFEAIIFSAGKIGYQIEANPAALSKVADVRFADIVG